MDGNSRGERERPGGKWASEVLMASGWCCVQLTFWQSMPPITALEQIFLNKKCNKLIDSFLVGTLSLSVDLSLWSDKVEQKIILQIGARSR